MVIRKRKGLKDILPDISDYMDRMWLWIDIYNTNDDTTIVLGLGLICIYLLIVSMSSYNNGFTVPTLSLTASRAKKQYSNMAPTRDYSQIVTSNTYGNQNDSYLDNKPSPIISNNPYTQP